MVTKGTKMGKGQVRELGAAQYYFRVEDIWAQLLLLDIPVLLRISYPSWRRGVAGRETDGFFMNTRMGGIC